MMPCSFEMSWRRSAAQSVLLFVPQAAADLSSTRRIIELSGKPESLDQDER